jgi:hypothetical protein
LEITKKEVKKLIELKEGNTFINHLSTIISRDFRVKGEIHSNKIEFWKQGFWNMTFYPIFTFEFNTEKHLISITDRINPVGKIFNIIIFMPLFILIVSHIINDFEFTPNWILIFLFTIIIALLTLIIRTVYRFEKQNQLDIIYKLLDIEVEDKKSEKEWSLKNIIIRIFMYSVCIGLISLAVFLLFPNGEITKALGSLAIAGAYLFSDIKILINKKTTGKNV